MLRKIDVPVKRGINRAVWNLRTDAFERPGRNGGAFFGNRDKKLAGKLRALVPES